MLRVRRNPCRSMSFAEGPASLLCLFRQRWLRCAWVKRRSGAPCRARAVGNTASGGECYVSQPLREQLYRMKAHGPWTFHS